MFFNIIKKSIINPLKLISNLEIPTNDDQILIALDACTCTGNCGAR